MAAFGAGELAGAGGNTTQLDTANLNVTGSNLALICGGGEDAGGATTFTLTWDPAGNNESMTGTFATVSIGSYPDATLQYLDDPTAANAPIRLDLSTSTTCAVMGTFFTAAGNIVATDTANDSATSGTALSVTVPNVVSGDMICDWCVTGDSSGAHVDGADQAEVNTQATSGSFLRASASYQAGADDDVMSWTTGTLYYGGILIGARIPDVGGAPAANPKGPFSMPFHGPFGGPIG